MERPSPSFSLDRVAPHERPLLDGLLQQHLRELAAFGGDQPDADGRVAYPWLDAYWQGTERLALLIRADDAVAGFCLINRWSVLDLPVDHAMAEFFIAPAHRRAGIGSAAVRRIVPGRRGTWEVAVLADNMPALAFWRGALSALDGLVIEGRRPAGDAGWDGVVFRFAVR